MTSARLECHRLGHKPTCGVACTGSQAGVQACLYRPLRSCQTLGPGVPAGASLRVVSFIGCSVVIVDGDEDRSVSLEEWLSMRRRQRSLHMYLWSVPMSPGGDVARTCNALLRAVSVLMGVAPLE